MQTGTNAEGTRGYNRRVVLNHVRRHGPLSRADLARRTMLTAQTVSNITAALIDEGLVVEQGRVRNGRGQPPLQLALNPAGGYLLGFVVQPQALVGVLTDLHGAVKAEFRQPLADASPAGAVPGLVALAARLLGEAGVAAAAVLGAGVVMPGPFGLDGPDTTAEMLPGWTKVDPASVLTAALGLPVVVENDATAAAVGEQLHGVARDLRHFACLFVGSGLGLGLILDARPYRGAHGNAGEVGHWPLVAGGRPCACGNTGCLERYVSMTALLDDLNAAGGEPPVTADALEALAVANHPGVLDWIRQAAGHLRPAIAMLENLFDPEAIVIGGAMPESILDGLVAALDPLLPSIAARPNRPRPRILRGSMGYAAPALGAAALPLMDSILPDRALLANRS